MRRLPTASAIDTAMACLGSCVLREASSEGDYSAGGSIIHKFLQYAKADRTSALGLIDDSSIRERCAAIDLDMIPDGAVVECAMAWNPRTDQAEMLTLEEARAYPDDGRYYGTGDIVGRIVNGVFVGDFKSGIAMAASDSWQLKALALMAARIAGESYAEVSMLPIGFDGRIIPDKHSLDAFDLMAIADALRNLFKRIQEADPATVPLNAGAHCKYCRALLCCPAQESLVRAVLPKLATLEGQVQALTLDETGQAWGWYYEVSDRLEQIKTALKLRIDSGEEPVLPDGRWMKIINSSTVKKSDIAKAEIANLCRDLELRSEIVSVPMIQIRPVGKKRTKKEEK